MLYLLEKIVIGESQKDNSFLSWLPIELIIIIANITSKMILIEKYGKLAPNYAALMGSKVVLCLLKEDG